MRSDEAEIQRALENDEFFPAFQPLIELRTGQLIGFEFWRDGSTGNEESSRLTILFRRLRRAV